MREGLENLKYDKEVGPPTSTRGVIHYDLVIYMAIYHVLTCPIRKR